VTSSATFRSYVLDQLARVVPRLRWRSMFGGVGIYDDDQFFALIAGDTLYFKADDVNRPDYEARGLEPFRPFEGHDEVMSYFTVDADTLEQVDELREWAEKAIDAARRKKTARRRKTGTAIKPTPAQAIRPIAKAIKPKTRKKQRKGR
jgi:DNA transformation protein